MALDITLIGTATDSAYKFSHFHYANFVIYKTHSLDFPDLRYL